MYFTRIELHNVGPYYGYTSFEPARGSRSPITLVTGMNGAGKTTFINALLLALYGSRSPAIVHEGVSYSSYLQRFRSRGLPEDEASHIAIDLELDGTTLRIRRSWQLAKIRYVDRLEVWRNGLADPLLARTWDSHVERILPVDLAPLFFFDAERIGELAEVEVLPRSLRRAIQSILGIATVDQTIANLDKLIRRVTTSVAKQSETAAQVRNLEAARRETEMKRRGLHQEAAKVMADLDRAERILADAKSDYLRLGGGLVGETSVTEADHVMEARQSALESRLLEQAAGPLPLQLARNLLHRIRQQSDEEERSQQAMLIIPILQERNDAVTKLLGNVLTPELAHEVHALLKRQLETLQRTAGFSIVFRLSYEARTLLSNLLSQELERVRRISLELLKNYQDVQRQRDFLELHREGAYDPVDLTKVLDRMTRAAERVGELKRRHAEITHQLAIVQRQLDNIARELARLGQDLADHHEQERILKFALKSRQAQEQFRAVILEQRAHKLERAIQVAMEKLLRKQNLVARIRLDPSSLSLRLYDSMDHVVPRLSLSSGERQMLAVATLWGLTMVSAEVLPVVIDTPMARLDSEHRLNFVTRYLPNAGEQVVVLSTDSEITDSDERVLAPWIGSRYKLQFDEMLGRSVLTNLSEVDLREASV